MAPFPKPTFPAGDRIPDVTVDPAAQADGQGRLAELAMNASQEDRARSKQAVAAVGRFRQIRSMTHRTVRPAKQRKLPLEQKSLLTEALSMDEERRSLAELHILQARAP